MQSFKKIDIKLYEALCSQGTQCLNIKGEKWLCSQCKKGKKKVINELHAHPLTMKKTHAKFHNDWYKTVRGVMLTRGTHRLYTEGENWLSSECGKSDKKQSNNYIQTTCISSYHETNTSKISKWLVQNCKRSCAHKTPKGKCWQKTNRQMDWNLHACRPCLSRCNNKTCCRQHSLPLKTLIKTFNIIF